MTAAPADILFADTDGLRRAVQTLPPETPPNLRTMPDAAVRLGPKYLRVVVDSVIGEQGRDTAVIDCGDAPGLVLKALAEGWRHVAFSGDVAMGEKLADIAAKHGATLHREAGSAGHSGTGS